MKEYVVQNYFRALQLSFASLEVTDQCNSRCKTCNIWKMQSGKPADTCRKLKKGQWKKSILSLQRLGCRAIGFLGGEPTLNKDLAELIAYCSRLGMASRVVTNGLSMSEALAAELVQAGLTEIRFSLDGSRNTHNEIRGRDDAFDKQIQSIERMQRTDPHNKVVKSINTTISSMNIGNIEDVIDVACAAKIRRIQVFLASVIDDEILEATNKIFGEDVTFYRSVLEEELHIRDSALIEAQRATLRERATAMGVSLNASTFFTMPVSAISQGMKRPKGPCPHIYHSCIVDSQGEVFPCEYIRYRLGNLKDDSLKDIYTSERFSNFTRVYSENIDKLEICNYCCYSM